MTNDRQADTTVQDEQRAHQTRSTRVARATASLFIERSLAIPRPLAEARPLRHPEGRVGLHVAPILARIGGYPRMRA